MTAACCRPDRWNVPVRAALFGSERNRVVDLTGSGKDLFWPAGKTSLVDSASSLNGDGDALMTATGTNRRRKGKRLETFFSLGWHRLVIT